MPTASRLGRRRYQTDVAACWDDDYLYVAAVLGETNGWATVFGDNENLTDGRAPWWDPDFEIFVNAARTTHGYVEFETNANNATYDVLWRVPQQGRPEQESYPLELILLCTSRGWHQHSNAAKISRDGARTAERRVDARRLR